MRKKFIAKSITVCGIMLLILSGCENNSDSLTKKNTSKETTQETPYSSAETKTNNNNNTSSSKKETAQKHIGDTLENLVSEIGDYSDFSKAASCYYEGEYDGIVQFDNFTVYCHSEGKTTWIIDSVE